MRCEQVDQSAPRVGCGCRECYEARLRALDPKLVELIQHDYRALPERFGPAHTIVHQCCNLYLGGKIEWAALQPMIIEELVKACDEQFKRELDRARLEVKPRIFTTGTINWG